VRQAYYAKGFNPVQISTSAPWPSSAFLVAIDANITHDAERKARNSPL